MQDLRVPNLDKSGDLVKGRFIAFLKSFGESDLGFIPDDQNITNQQR